MRLVRPSVLVDVNHAGLGEITANGGLRIGATVRQAALAGDERVHPLVRQALPFVGHFVTRNRGTVGGSIAHADGAAELPLCLAVLDGVVVGRAGRGRREIAAADFFVTHFLDDARSRGSSSSRPSGRSRRTARRARSRSSRSAPATSRSRWSPWCSADDGVVVEARVGVGAVTDRPTRLAEVEALLVGSSGGDAAAEAGALAARLVDPPSTTHASSGYLRALTGHARPAGDRAGAMIEIELTVNGRVVRETVEPRLLLTDFLRHRLGLTGTHVGCEHGICGACTVLLDGVAVRGCCLLAVQADGATVSTVESLAGHVGARPAAGGVPTPPRAPVRVLHAGDPHGGDRPPGARDADARRDRRHALRAPLPLHRLRADRRRDRGGRARVNLAQSLLGACERHPELEAFPGITYGELLPRVRRIAGGLGVNPGERVALVLDNRLETALLYWACQWAGAVAVPLSWRLSEDELGYCIEDCGAAVVIRDGDALPDGAEHAGLSTATSARRRSSSTRRGRPAGRRACRARTRPTARAGGRRRSSTATRGATARSA